MIAASRRDARPSRKNKMIVVSDGLRSSPVFREQVFNCLFAASLILRALIPPDCLVEMISRSIIIQAFIALMILGASLTSSVNAAAISPHHLLAPPDTVQSSPVIDSLIAPPDTDTVQPSPVIDSLVGRVETEPPVIDSLLTPPGGCDDCDDCEDDFVDDGICAGVFVPDECF
ncbi:hypothetical protein F5888DRAFT_1904248 [Russula emetica]|nr:hypothetical protein F5888DRAFT_1904248 [Russula emetica]